MRSQIRNRGTLIAIAAALLIVTFGPVADASSKKAATTEIIKQMIKKKAGSVQLVHLSGHRVEPSQNRTREGPDEEQRYPKAGGGEG